MKKNNIINNNMKKKQQQKKEINEREITEEKLKKYFEVTETAFEIAKKSANRTLMKTERVDFLDMISRYISDAKHFEKNKEYVNAFAALNYAHGWLDAGARIGIFDVHDSKYFTVDDK